MSTIEAVPLTQQQIQIVKSTAPVLAQHGVAITKHFYNRMFTNHPELKNIFNQAHQRSGDQPTALAHAVYAYAANIDNLGVLGDAVKKIAHKHASLQIQANQYPIVGENLLASIKEVLGDAITPEIIEAWRIAYNQLAKILIDAEAALYAQTAAKQGGWNGWKAMKIMRKEQESNEVTSFYLKPIDDTPLPSYEAGQYISIKLWCPELNYFQPRQYSLSDILNTSTNEYRISVKKHESGVVSPMLHTHLHVGDTVEVSAPYGDFTLENHETPLVLVAGGIGCTPLLSMMNASLVDKPSRPIYFLHAVRNGQARPFESYINALCATNDNVHKYIVYGSITEQDKEGINYDAVGHMELHSIPDMKSLVAQGSHFYVCGPIPFMNDMSSQLKNMGVDVKHIHSEVFGSETR